MKRVAGWLAVLLLVLVAPAGARTPVETEQTAVNPALFVVRDEDSTLYLFGTVHVRRPGSAWGGANAQAPHAENKQVHRVGKQRQAHDELKGAGPQDQVDA